MLVSVCMCTYKRDSLDKTLESIVSQVMPEGFTFEIVVVDNDIEESGRSVCESYRQHPGPVAVRYFANSVRNLSEVRNATMEHAKGELLAFIDDDEWASDERWLSRMIVTMQQFDADVVFGKVCLLYTSPSPRDRG